MTIKEIINATDDLRPTLRGILLALAEKVEPPDKQPAPAPKKTRGEKVADQLLAMGPSANRENVAAVIDAELRAERERCAAIAVAEDDYWILDAKPRRLWLQRRCHPR